MQSIQALGGLGGRGRGLKHLAVLHLELSMAALYILATPHYFITLLRYSAPLSQSCFSCGT